MKNLQLKQSSMTNRGAGNDLLAELFKKLEGSARLTASDKPIFATNLGKLAARLSPDDPLDGARRIVLQAGNESLWPTKRKKYFRLPGEDAAAAGKDGEYASNPSQFRKLAEAAGELLSASKKPEAIKLEQRKAVKALAHGSSFMPNYVPTDISDISAVALLDEYAAALADAIKERTRITELWEVLKTTQISVKPFWPYETGEAGASPYGSAAEFPQSLLQAAFRKGAVMGEFKAEHSFGGWSEPTLPIGYLVKTQKIRMFRIPKDKQVLFSPEHSADRILSRQAVEWLEDVGFDGEAGTLPDLAVVEDDMGWCDVTATITQDVGISIRPNFENSEPEVIIRLWGDYDYLVASKTDTRPLETHLKNKFKSNENISQHWSYEFNENIGLDLIYNESIDMDDNHKFPVIGIIPSSWNSKFSDWECSNIFIGPNNITDLWENDLASGWSEDPHIAKTLLTDEHIFVPMIPESYPVGGVFPKHSIGASLMQNQRNASRENLITQLLIDQITLTADAGLKFYEAMVDDLRSAIHRI